MHLTVAKSQIERAEELTYKLKAENKAMSKLLRKLEAETGRAGKAVASSKNYTTSRNAPARSLMKESSKKRRSLTKDRSKSAAKTAKTSEKKKWKRNSNDPLIEFDCDIPLLSIEKKAKERRKIENSDDNEENKKQLKTSSTGSRPRTVKRRASSSKERRFSQFSQSSDIADDNLPYSFA